MKRKVLSFGCIFVLVFILGVVLFNEYYGLDNLFIDVYDEPDYEFNVVNAGFADYKELNISEILDDSFDNTFEYDGLKCTVEKEKHYIIEKTKDNKIRISDLYNNKSRIVKGINNVKKIGFLHNLSCYDASIIILTKAGNIYFTDFGAIAGMNSYMDFEKVLNHLNFEYKFDDIDGTVRFSYYILKLENGEKVLLHPETRTNSGSSFNLYKFELKENSNSHSVNPFLVESISLNDSHEIFEKDGLIVEFNAINTEMRDEYFYSAAISYNGNLIDTDFYSGKNQYRIRSSNMASGFDIYQIDNVYIMDSWGIAQCGGHEILVFNTNGEVLNSFRDATIEFDTDSSEDSEVFIELSFASDNENRICSLDSSDSNVKINTYKISNYEMIKINGD